MIPRALADGRSHWQGTEPSDRLSRWQYFLSGMSDPFRQREVELLLLRPRQWRDGRQGMPQGAEDAESALDPIGANGIRNSQQIATRIMSFVSFHSAILKQGVGHGLSDGERISKHFSL
jgi:hypothetical protein